MLAQLYVRPWTGKAENFLRLTKTVAHRERAKEERSDCYDAESWVGEIWADLAEHGVAAVTLFEHERLVYGPMSLSA